MKPVDVRNASFEQLQEQISGDRLRVWERLLRDGPQTTRQLAAAMSMDLLRVRPRVTELYQLGFVRMSGVSGREGIYRAVSLHDARQAFELAREPKQLEMAL